MTFIEYSGVSLSGIYSDGLLFVRITKPTYSICENKFSSITVIQHLATCYTIRKVSRSPEKYLTFWIEFVRLTKHQFLGLLSGFPVSEIPL